MDEVNETVAANDSPLSAEEERAWAMMVEEGRKIRAPIVARQDERRRIQNERCSAGDAEKGRKVRVMLKGKTKDSMEVVPNRTRRWVVLRMAGVSFKKAGVASGATWLDVQDAKYHNEEFRCALAAMEENSRQLMKAKAQSVVEQSQEEDARVSMAQTQVSMMILKTLDRDHFGDDRRESVAEEVQKQLGGGGFVINLIGDAAKTAEAVPEKRPGKALVYTDV